MSQLDDLKSISNLMHERRDVDLKYTQSNLEYIQDSNGNSYSQSQPLIFDTLSCSGKWVDMHQGFLRIPLTIASAGPFSADSYLACKQSLLSLVEGIQIKSGNGQTLVDERGSMYFSRNLDLLLNHDDDWEKSRGSELHFAVDRVKDSVQNGLVSSATIINPKGAKFTTAVSGTANSDSTVYNDGFAKRWSHLMNQRDSGATVNTMNVTVTIPLKYLHPFFAEGGLDFPFINTRLQMYIYLNTTGASYSPLCLGTNAAGTVESAYTITHQINNPSRIYYRNVLFSKDEASKVNSMLQAGIKKEVQWDSYDINRTYAAVSASSSFIHNVSPSTVNPKKIFLMMYPSSVDSVNWPSPVVTGPFGASNLNILVNNTRYFSSDLSNLEEQWDALRTLMPQDSGESVGLLSFKDFKNTHRIHLLDISRSGKMVDPNAPVSLVVVGTAPATPCDFVYLVQKRFKMSIDFSTSEVKFATPISV